MANVLRNKGNFIIGSTQYSPQKIRPTFESISSENSGRVKSGKMYIEWVYNRVRKIEIEMPPMTSAQVSDLLMKVQGKIYNMTYFDPLANAEVTKEFYTGNSQSECYSGVVQNGLYIGVGFNAIETGGELDAN